MWFRPQSDYWATSFSGSGETKADADIAHVLTMDEARRICLPRHLGPSPCLAVSAAVRSFVRLHPPGTKRRQYLEENVGALDIRLTADELAEIDSLLPRGAAAGSRYSEHGMRAVNR